jgi:hypothetical protein
MTFEDETHDATPDGTGEDFGPSRRRMLKQAGVVAGVAWAAPVLSSVFTAAHAQTGSPPPGSSTTGPTTPPQPCDEQTIAGGQGVTVTQHELGQTSGTFDFFYNANAIPDQFDVRYEGDIVFTTGTLVSGSATVAVTYGPGASTVVEVTVTGPDASTAWDYTVFCPS